MCRGYMSLAIYLNSVRKEGDKTVKEEYGRKEREEKKMEIIWRKTKNTSRQRQGDQFHQSPD